MTTIRKTESDSVPPKPSVPSPKLKFPLGLVAPGVRPYLELTRVDKPAGTILIFWPFAWGLTLAAYTSDLPLPTYLWSFVRFMLGAFIVRSAGCTVNDIFDRKVDASVERTKKRPLASGRITVLAATIFLLVQFHVGLVFFSTFNKIAFICAVTQLIPLASIYPLMKRVTNWPQAWLGIAMNFGVLVAWSATTGSLDNVLQPCLLLAGAWCWTMLYDTIYACQDKKDDVKAGIGSTALFFGDYVQVGLIFFGAVFVSMLAVVGVMNGQGPAYFVLTVGGTALHIIWQLSTVDLDSPASCWEIFNRNGDLGWIVWGGLFVDYLLKAHLLDLVSLSDGLVSSLLMSALRA